MKETINTGKAEIITTPEYDNKLGPVNVSDDSKYILTIGLIVFETGIQIQMEIFIRDSGIQ